MNKEEVRQLLNNQSSKLFDDIVNSRVLGANNHIRMIGEIMLLTAEDESENGKSVLYKVRETARFFMETRGQQSRAVYHAIQYYIKGLGGRGDPGPHHGADRRLWSGCRKGYGHAGLLWRSYIGEHGYHHDL